MSAAVSEFTGIIHKWFSEYFYTVTMVQQHKVRHDFTAYHQNLFFISDL